MSEDEAAAMNDQLRERGLNEQLRMQYVPADTFSKPDGSDEA